MAFRTPGLLANNQFHRNWGNWTDGTASTGDLPNMLGNVLSASEFAKLEPGDLAYVTGTLPGVYYCVSVGTLGAGTQAVWTLLAAGGSVIQTIRDAHQLVVAQSTAPYEISTVGSGPNSTALSCDFLDAGDGIALTAALAAASALTAAGYFGVDVRVRPCNIVLAAGGPPALPMTIPSDVRLIGAGNRHTLASRITGPDGTGVTTQEIFQLGSDATLEGFHIISVAAAVAPAAGTAMIMGNPGAILRDCRIDLQGGGAASRSFGVAFHSNPGGVGTSIEREEVQDCVFVLADLLQEGLQSTAIQFGVSAVHSIQTGGAGLVKGCRVTGGQRAVYCLNTPGIAVEDIEHINAVAPPGSIAHAITSAGGGPTRGMKIDGFFLSVTIADTQDRTGIVIQNAAAQPLVGTQMDNVQQVWPAVVNPLNGRDGVLLGAGLAFELTDVQISNLSLRGADGTAIERGIVVDATADGSIITDISVVNYYISGADLYGVYLFGAGAPDGAIERFSMANSKCLNAGASGIEIEASANNTMILGNHFVGSFVGITDAGTLTEAAHNIS